MASLRHRLSDGPAASPRFLWGAAASVCLADVGRGTSLGGRLSELAGTSVLVATRDPLAAGLALMELDGVARRLVVCTPDLPSEHLRGVAAGAEADAIVSDDECAGAELDVALRVRVESACAF